ncbi:hypothetical protein SAMN06265371_101152 [Lutibacter agarilyticus]|uniref:Fibronectin type-III domain-containing protein n=1 Tax=Lutibacter agarilyticus TaxID=1109740 RepID=A0A238VAU5_9FLAO|nr:hypothetical protein [Lutibacter agarilyticus]SNR31530.1 hypothetical protein SAMN06265371_101152 [Lutibacter agarilyticus]
MKNLFKITVLFFSLTIVSCGGSNDDTPPPPVVENPTAADLVLPLKNEECNQGNIISETLSRVKFEWNKSENTDKYTLVLKNLSTNETTETNTSSTTISQNIARGTSFSWKIISISNSNSTTATSETWNFFNAGKPVENYIPFPAEVVSPPMGGLTDYVVTLKWNGSDIDNDIDKYEVYLDVNSTPTTLFETTTNTTIQNVSLNTNTVYYWYVKTIDKHGNSSISPTFEFTTK